MFGQHWDPAKATIVETRIKSAGGSGTTVNREFVADVWPAAGDAFRATIQTPAIATNFWDPGVGDEVAVLVNRRSGKVKFDKSDPALSARDQIRAKDERFAMTAREAPGSRATANPGTLEQSFGDPAHRLALLDDLHGRGSISDAEYAAQRTRIIGGI